MFCRIAAACALALLCLCGVAAAAPIDDYRYDRATHCVKHPAPGMVALQHWLEGHSRGSSWGIIRGEKLGNRDYSLHAEGRALDWHLDVHDPADRRAADRLIRLLLAPDANGNQHALARRMGVPGDHLELPLVVVRLGGNERVLGLLRPQGPAPQARGRDTRPPQHVHIGMNLAGARMRTSFWRR